MALLILKPITKTCFKDNFPDNSNTNANPKGKLSGGEIGRVPKNLFSLKEERNRYSLTKPKTCFQKTICDELILVDSIVLLLSTTFRH